MNIRKILIPALLLLAIALVVAWASLSDKKTDSGITIDDSPGVEGDSRGIVLDFYEVWMEARRSTTTDPYAAKLVPTAAFSKDLNQKIADAENDFRTNEKDPILCQYEVPEKLRVKVIFENEKAAQLLITPKENTLATQVVVDLDKRAEGFWLIKDISCGSGEQAPDVGEFSFDREGFLMKDSLPAPLDSQYWHLVFEQNGVMGHTAPLFLSGESNCILKDGEEKVCTDEVLFETMRVTVKGSLTEAGVDVKRIEESN